MFYCFKSKKVLKTMKTTTFLYLLIYCLSMLGLSTIWCVMVSSVTSYVLPMQTDLSQDTSPPKHLEDSNNTQKIEKGLKFITSSRFSLQRLSLTWWETPATLWALPCWGRTWAPQKAFSELPAVSVPFPWPPYFPCPPGKKEWKGNHLLRYFIIPWMLGHKKMTFKNAGIVVVITLN